LAATGEQVAALRKITDKFAEEVRAAAADGQVAGKSPRGPRSEASREQTDQRTAELERPTTGTIPSNGSPSSPGAMERSA